MIERTWSIFEAIAWVMTRDESRLANLPETIGAMTIWRITVPGLSSAPDVTAAWDRLRQRLIDGTIQATVLGVPVLPHEWEGVAGILLDYQRIAYRAARFPVEAVKATFPIPPPPITPWQFWHSTALWPQDSEGAVFLARATGRIAALAVPGWVGQEPWVQELEPIYASSLPLPENPIDARPDQIDLAIELLRLGEAPTPIRLADWQLSGPLTRVHFEGSENVRPTAAEWEVVRKNEQWLVEQYNLASERWETTIATMWALFQKHTLKMVLRPVSGGAFVHAPDYLWNVDLESHRPLIETRFGLCQIDLGHPFDQAHWQRQPGNGLAQMGQDFRYVFVTGESLDQALKAISNLLTKDQRSRRRGRKPGDGKIDDSAGLEYMRVVLSEEFKAVKKERKAKSAREAAQWAVDAGKVPEGISDDAKVKRLASAYLSKSAE